MIKLKYDTDEIIEHFQAGMLYVHHNYNGFLKVESLNELLLLSRKKARFYLYST